MKRNLFIIPALALLLLVTDSCNKSSTSNDSNCVSNNTGIPTSAEIASLQAYLSSHNITNATLDPGGFYYYITVMGTGANPTPASIVTFKYTGKLENGTVFEDNQAGVTYQLSQLILGFQKGMPLIKKGGYITLYLPPSLGYGCNQAGAIPPGSNLIFNVELINVQ